MAESDYEAVWIGAAEMQSNAEWQFQDENIFSYLEPTISSGSANSGSWGYSCSSRRGGFGYLGPHDFYPVTYRVSYKMNWRGWLPSNQSLLVIQGYEKEKTTMEILLNEDTKSIELWTRVADVLTKQSVLFNLRPFCSSVNDWKDVGIVVNLSTNVAAIYVNSVHIGTFSGVSLPSPTCILVGKSYISGNYISIDNICIEFSPYSESIVAPPTRKFYESHPSANGSANEWTPTGSVNNYDCVNETTAPDNLSTYVSTTTIDEIEMYEFDSVSIDDNETPEAAYIQIYCRKTPDDGRKGFGSLRTIYKGTGPADFGVIRAIYPKWLDGVEWDVIFDQFKTVPGYGAWTLTHFNGGQFGYQAKDI